MLRGSANVPTIRSLKEPKEAKEAAAATAAADSNVFDTSSLEVSSGSGVHNAKLAGDGIGVDRMENLRNPGALAGIIIAIIALLVALYFCVRRLSKKEEEVIVEEQKVEPKAEPSVDESGDDTSSTATSANEIAHIEVEEESIPCDSSEDNFVSDRDFVDADIRDLGKHHSTLDVHQCNSWLCKACMDKSVKFVTTRVMEQIGSMASECGSIQQIADEPNSGGLCTVNEAMVAKYVRQEHEDRISLASSQVESHKDDDDDDSRVSGQRGISVDLNIEEDTENAGGVETAHTVEDSISELGEIEQDVTLSEEKSTSRELGRIEEEEEDRILVNRSRSEVGRIKDDLTLSNSSMQRSRTYK